jgi:hypothetical protein
MANIIHTANERVSTLYSTAQTGLEQPISYLDKQAFDSGFESPYNFMFKEKLWGKENCRGQERGPALIN